MFCNRIQVITFSCLLVVSVFSSLAFAHSSDNVENISLLDYKSKRVSMTEVDKSGKFDLKVVEGVVDLFRLWQTGSTLKVCFFKGTPKARAFFVKTSREISKYANLTFNFGTDSLFKNCDGNYYHIRVSFDNTLGNWSYIGTDSIRVEMDKSSLNIAYASLYPFDGIDKNKLKAVILHELGHAVALEHEHQNPKSNCNGEFNWDKVYKIYKDNNWDKNKVDRNLRTLVNKPRLRVTAYDKKSIMHYYFPEWMFFQGSNSKCFIKENILLSSMDKQMLSINYPSSSREQISLINKKSIFSKTLLNTITSTEEQKKWLNKQVEPLASTIVDNFSFFSTIDTKCNSSTTSIISGDKSVVLNCLDNSGGINVNIGN